MTFYQRLLAETAQEREAFTRIPVIARTMREGASPALYRDFLSQAYYHVRQTCPLLARALSLLPPGDSRGRDALIAYLDEEKGHDEWILDDIRALGGDAEAVRHGQPRLPCKVMIAYAWYGIDHVSPYCLLGMVHVLEGMSAQLATHAAHAIAQSLGADGAQGGFSYLTSHGTLDQDHVSFFINLVNGIDDRLVEDHIIAAARDVYRLYGAIFADLRENGEA